MADVNFNLANPYQTQLNELARRQKMAEIMQQQSFQPMERFSYQGIEAPISPLAGLTKALQGYMGGKAQRDIADERKAVGEKSQSDLIATMTRANELAMGKPAMPEQAPATRVDDEGNPMPVVAASPAVAPNREAATIEYFKHPATQAMGMAEMQKSAQLQRLLRAGQPAEAMPVAIQPTAAGQTPVAGQPVGQQTAPTAGKPVASTLTKWGQPAGGQPFAVWMEIDPSGKLYTEQLAKEFSETNKPTDIIRNLRAAGVQEGSPQWNAALSNVNTAGGIFNVNQQGQTILAPGFAIGTGQIKTAEEEAKAAFDIVEVAVPGGVQKMTRADAVKYLQRTPAKPTTNSQGEITGIPVQDIAKARAAGIPVNTPANRGIGFTQDQAIQAADKTRSEKRATNEVAREEQLLRTGYQEAQSMINNLDLMQSLASDPNVAQGKLADQISGLKSIGQSLGIRTEGLPAEEAIRAISVEMALKAKNQGGTNLMPGAMAVAETQMLQSMTPQLAQSREGRNLLIQVFRQKALRDQKISELATDYYDRNGKLDYNFEKEVRAFAKANPMFSDNQMQAIRASLKILSEKK